MDYREGNRFLRMVAWNVFLLLLNCSRWSCPDTSNIWTFLSSSVGTMGSRPRDKFIMGEDSTEKASSRINGRGSSVWEAFTSKLGRGVWRGRSNQHSEVSKNTEDQIAWFNCACSVLEMICMCHFDRFWWRDGPRTSQILFFLWII